MKHIVCLLFAEQHAPPDTIFEYSGQEFKLTYHATNYDQSLTRNLIRKYDGIVDVIALTGIPGEIKYSKGSFIHRQVVELLHTAKETMVVDGKILKNIFIPWAFRKHALVSPLFQKKINAGFYASVFLQSLFDTLDELGHQVEGLDPYFLVRLPYTVDSKKSLHKFVRLLLPIFKRKKLKGKVYSLEKGANSKYVKDFLKNDIFFLNENLLNLIDLAQLKGKHLFLDTMSDETKEKVKNAGVLSVTVTLPNILNVPQISYPIVEAVLQCLKDDSSPLNAEDILSWDNQFSLNFEVHQFSPILEGITKFAFVIHPLSADFILKHPQLKHIKNMKLPVGRILENVISLSPGFFYGKLKGIKSEKTNEEIEGLIYTVTETPKKLLQKDPQVIYKKIVNLCHSAKKAGASIIGLGAYTKIVGDAGITIERLSPLPVTTGNSLSAASTLWAAKLAIEKMGFVQVKDNFSNGTVMIVGATGSIGAVTAKVLASTWEHMILVAPTAHKLLTLKEAILKIRPDCKLTIGTDPDKFSGECDLIITTTSAQGKRVLDINKVKPGSVICDVSRPFDIRLEDAVKRPDVLVIASGEVQLPGTVKSKMDLGLEGNIVYACLAETALLAMANRLESFTLSRNISYQKVIEIDKLAKEHGVRLAQIMGHNGFITDNEFELCKKHATEKLKEWPND